MTKEPTPPFLMVLRYALRDDTFQSYTLVVSYIILMRVIMISPDVYLAVESVFLSTVALGSAIFLFNWFLAAQKAWDRATYCAKDVLHYPSPKVVP